MRTSIRELRGEVKLTQSQLATALGLDSSTVSRYEKGELVPSETVVRLMLFQFGLLGCGETSAYAALSDVYDLDVSEFKRLDADSSRIHSILEPSPTSWLDGVAENELAVLRDFWMARRLGDPDMVDDIEGQIRAIKRISRKRGVWRDEKRRKSA